MSDYSTSRFIRSARIAKTGLRVGTNYAMHHFKKKFSGDDIASRKSVHTTNARLLYDEFSKLRGTALKLAQTLSLDHGLLPEEFIETMSQAQYRVSPISKAMVRHIIKKELGNYPEVVFAQFNAEASAAASIGQVHKAVLQDGKNVVVKIQYPNVRTSIDSDLSMVKMVFRRMIRSDQTDRYFGEIRQKMMEETDYLNEGRQIADFHKRYHGKQFNIPEYLPEYSTANILTMTAVSGDHLPEFLAKTPSQSKKDHYGQLLWDFFHAQINASRTLHADAHPGNFMLCSDGRLGVVDFGCVKKCPVDFFTDYVSLLPYHLEGDEDILRRCYRRLELIRDPSDDPDYERTFYELCRTFGDLVVTPYRKPVFHFGDKSFSTSYREAVKTATAQPELRGTHHFIYVTRAHVGLYHMLMQLEARIKTQDGKDKVLAYCNTLNGQ